MFQRFSRAYTFLALATASASAFSARSGGGGSGEQQQFGGFDFSLANAHVNTGNVFAPYLHHHRVFVGTPPPPAVKNHVGDVMRVLHRTPAVFLDDSVDDALTVMLANSHDVPSVAVLDRDDRSLRGVLQPWDVLHRAADAGIVLPLDDGDDPNRMMNMASAVRPLVAKTVQELLPSGVELISVTPKTTIKAAAALLQDHRLQYLPVVDDEDGSTLVGCLSAMDVLRGILPPLARDVPKPLPDTERVSVQMFSIFRKNTNQNSGSEQLAP